MFSTFLSLLLNTVLCYDLFGSQKGTVKETFQYRLKFGRTYFFQIILKQWELDLLVYNSLIKIFLLIYLMGVTSATFKEIGYF